MTTNRIRIQFKPIEVPDDDPFKHDLLGREKFAETLARTLRTIEGPGVFAIDGAWGTGKTTFVAMFSQHLRNEGLRVVNINAWETDYADSPLAALVSKVAEAEPEQSCRDTFKNVGKQALKAALPAAVRIASYALVDIGAGSGKAVGDALAKFAEGGLARFEEGAQCMVRFKEGLQDLARNEDDPLVVIVDELDRCRPTYAVEMLETIKHAFDVDNVVFVLVMNRQQLDQSAATLYGRFLDPESYFRRFFDVESRLPDADKTDVVRTLLMGHHSAIDRSNANLLANVLGASPYSMRTMDGLLRHYATVSIAMLAYNHEAWSWILPVAILLRHAVATSYYDFVSARISDADLVEAFFGLPWTPPLRGTQAANSIEATVIVIAAHRSASTGRGGSVLLERYRESVDEHSEVLNYVDRRSEKIQLSGFKFDMVTERIEAYDLAGLTR